MESTNKNIIYVTAPANTGADLSKEIIEIGVKRLNRAGYRVEFGKAFLVRGSYGVASLKERLRDFNEALDNEEVSIIMPVFGGYNSNQLLDYLDYEKIKKANKIIIGYSDITAILNGIYVQTGKIMLHGISFASVCDPNMYETAFDEFLRVINGESNIVLKCPDYFSDDLWFLKENYGPRDQQKHSGWKSYKEGVSEGVLIGGNLETLLALTGTSYLPDFEKAILLIEAEMSENPRKFLRDMTQLDQMGVFQKINGLIIGQFSHTSDLYNESIFKDIMAYFEKKITCPVLYNTNFSHTDPLYTLPIGGKVQIVANDNPYITIIDSIYE